MTEVNIQDVRKFLSTTEKPVSMTEFKEFWAALSDEEKNDYKRQIGELSK